MNLIRFLWMGFVLILSWNFTFAEEEKVPLDKLPAAITKAVKDKFPKAELVSAEKEKDDGKIMYEVKIKDGKIEIELQITEDGTITEVEKSIEVADFPKAVKEALDAKYPKATLKKPEEITKDGKITYEVLVEAGKDKIVEVVLDPMGKILKEEDKTNDKDDKDEKKDEKQKDKQ